MKHTLSLLLAGVLTAASLSAQALSWTKRDPKVNSEITMNAVTFGAGKYAAVGYRGTFINGVNGIQNQVTTSADGATWTAGPALPTNGAIRSIAYGGGLFAVPIESNSETSLILTSPDAVTWTARATGAGQLSSIAYGNGVVGTTSTPMWVAVGSANGGSNVSHSTDGITWTRVNTGRTVDLFQVVSGRFVFLAISRSGTLLSSSNGTTWTAVTVPGLPAGATFLGITFDGTQFLLLVNDGSRNPQIFVSGDGSAWAASGSKLTAATLFDGTLASNGTLAAVVGASSVSGNVVFTAPITAGFFATVGAWSNAQVVDASGFGFVFITNVNNLWIAGGYDAALYTAASTGGSGGGGTTTPAPVVTTQPAAQSATVGGSVTFSAAASGTGNTYQWRFNTTAISGATNATYTIPSVTAANAGAYSVIITNAGGSVTSNAATLTVSTATASGRLINLSVLTSLSSATDEFTLGYVVGGPGTSGAKPLVIRAAGPSLGALGVPGTISDPQLETFAGSTKTGENDNWGGGTTLTNALAAVGAFAYTGPTSRDAAVSTSITSRDNSVRVTGVAGATGTVIAEVYDATASANFTAATPRLLNVSVRKALGTGLTAGFVLGGSGPTKVLIRVVGPGLAAFGVPGTVVDPQLVLFNDKSVKIGENDNWGGTAELTAAFNSVGAFAFPSATSRDAALIATLQPGGYSVQASGVGGTTGVGIVEVYELP